MTKIHNSVYTFSAKANSYHKTINKLEELTYWQELDIPLKKITEGTKFLDFYTILINTEQINSLIKGLESSCTAFAINEIQDMETYKSLLVTAFKSERTQVEEQISKCEAQTVSLPPSDENAAQLNQRDSKKGSRR